MKLWVTCEWRDLDKRAPDTNPAALGNKTPALKMLLKIKHVPGVRLSTAKSLNTHTLKGFFSATATDHIQAGWSDPWEFDNKSGALFEPWGHHPISFPFCIFCPAQSSSGCFPKEKPWIWGPGCCLWIPGLAINLTHRRYYTEKKRKKRKLQTLPSAKEQLVPSSSSPGSFGALWHSRGVFWAGISSEVWGSSFSRFPQGSRSCCGQKCSPASSQCLGLPKNPWSCWPYWRLCECECVWGFGHFPLSHAPLHQCFLL